MTRLRKCSTGFILLFMGLAVPSPHGFAQAPPPVPVKVAPVIEETVATQIALIGTTEGIKTSRVASEVGGIVESFPAKAGDFVEKGAPLAQLRDTSLRLRLKGVLADRERIQADLQLARRELDRAEKLKKSNSIAQKNYDEALFRHQALKQALVKSEAEIDYTRYQIEQKRILAPFSGFIAKEYSQVGEWITGGGAVVSLLDLERIRIEVGVPERYAVNLAPGMTVSIVLKNLSAEMRPGTIHTILPEADPTSRNFTVRIEMENPEFKIRSGMEAEVRFNLPITQKALLVPKDAIVTAGNNRMVYTVAEGKALPMGIKVLGYYGGNAAVAGTLKPGMPVVIRGNERLRPGQSVSVIDP